MRTLKIRLFCLVMIFANHAYSQKLPSIQNTGFRAPKDVKVDGRAREWGNVFQAHNKREMIDYTIANDGKYIYLVVQAKEEGVYTKILYNGFSFSIVKDSSKKQDAISITFPAQTKGTIRGLLGRATLSNVGESQKKLTQSQLDSASDVFTRGMIDKKKNIVVKGIAKFPDTLISMYNEDQITARSLFDGNRVYTYELSFPIDYLGLNIGQKKFRYEIKMNGTYAPDKFDMLSGYYIGKLDLRQLSVATGFSGSYAIVE